MKSSHGWNVYVRSSSYRKIDHTFYYFDDAASLLFIRTTMAAPHFSFINFIFKFFSDIQLLNPPVLGPQACTIPSNTLCSCNLGKKFPGHPSIAGITLNPGLHVTSSLKIPGAQRV
jgi:hypothetical protein